MSQIEEILNNSALDVAVPIDELPDALRAAMFRRLLRRFNVTPQEWVKLRTEYVNRHGLSGGEWHNFEARLTSDHIDEETFVSILQLLKPLF